MVGTVCRCSMNICDVLVWLVDCLGWPAACRRECTAAVWPRPICWRAIAGRSCCAEAGREGDRGRDNEIEKGSVRERRESSEGGGSKRGRKRERERQGERVRESRIGRVGKRDGE